MGRIFPAASMVFGVFPGSPGGWKHFLEPVRWAVKPSFPAAAAGARPAAGRCESTMDMKERTVMAKATQYEVKNLCRAILDAVGGSQNIANVFHCITRLRIVPVNRDLVDMDKLSSIKGILKVVESSGQIQCVIGTTVPEVYNDFIAISGINPGGEVKADAADTASDAAAVQEKKQNLIIRGLNTLAACVTPYLYAIVAGGMIKGIVSLITALGLAASDSDIITVLSAVGDAPFYFMPFMAVYAAAKRFRVKQV